MLVSRQANDNDKKRPDKNRFDENHLSLLRCWLRGFRAAGNRTAGGDRGR